MYSILLLERGCVDYKERLGVGIRILYETVDDPIR